MDQTKVILSDQTVFNVADKDTKIEYDDDGNVIINEDEVVKNVKSFTSGSENKIAMNQIVVPRGKRANISFSDGTKIWLNSGSHVIYPVEFQSQKREIYIEGEVYLEVKSDDIRPFIVKTKDLDIRVLGTSFNINFYPDEECASVVLVEGALEIKDQKNKHILSPKELYNYNVISKSSEIRDDINIYEYIGWKDGWILCNSEKLFSVFEKLERYYDIKISVADEEARVYKISGKLHLKDEIKDVIEVIATTAPIKYEVENDMITIYSKNKKM